MGIKEAYTEMNDFFKLESLATSAHLKCRACKCGHCPVPGSRYSQREESELKLIEENLFRNPNKKGWIMSYPVLHLKELLRGDRVAAMKSL